MRVLLSLHVVLSGELKHSLREKKTRCTHFFAHQEHSLDLRDGFMMELKSQTIRNQSPQRRLQAATQDAQALTNELCRFSANLKTTGLQWSGISLTCFNLRSPSIPSLTWHFSHLGRPRSNGLYKRSLLPQPSLPYLQSLSLLQAWCFVLQHRKRPQWRENEASRRSLNPRITWTQSMSSHLSREQQWEPQPPPCITDYH
jgi:hypothetical protein